MGIKDISLANGIRYLFGSVFVWIYMAFLNFDKAKVPLENIIDSTGGGGAASIAVLALLTLATSTLIYFLYRSLFYDPVVMSVLDSYCQWKKRQTYRIWVTDVLKDKKSIKTLEAQHLANLIDEEKLGDKHYTDNIRRAYAGSHALYLAGVLAWLTPLANWWWLSLNVEKDFYGLLVLFLFGPICCLAGFLQDARQSELGALALRAKTPNSEVIRIAGDIGLIDSPSDTDESNQKDRKHSRLGIASFIVSFSAWILPYFTFIWLVLIFLPVAMGLGIGGLLQREKKKTFAIFGTFLSSVLFVIIIIITIYGIINSLPMMIGGSSA